MATIKEVAKLAGVGTSTVTRYFKEGSYISEEAKEKIKKACEELNYFPNAIARAMKSNKSYTIGLMIPTITNPFFTELVETIEQNFMKAGYKTVLCNTNGNIELEKNYLKMAISSCFDGIIFITGSSKFEDLESNIPTLTLDRKNSKPNSNITIISDHRQGAVIGSKHLIDCGCNKILYLSGGDNIPSKERQAAFEEVMKEYGIVYEVKEWDIITEDEKEGLLKKGFDGVFAWNDITAIELLNYLYKKNKKVPEEIQILGFDNIKMSEWVHPKLTTVSQPVRRLGEEAFRCMIGLIEQKISPPFEIILENTLVIRETTKGFHDNKKE